MTIDYRGDRDELRAVFSRKKGGRTAGGKGMHMRWDESGNLCVLDIRPYRRYLREFQACLSSVKMGGILRPLRVSDDDIRDIRDEMWASFEGRW